jgi:hypothetical protein
MELDTSSSSTQGTRGSGFSAKLSVPNGICSIIRKILAV